MRTFIDAKSMAKSLRDALQSRGISATHSDSLEFIAQAFGFADWNVLAAKIEHAKSTANAAAKPAIEFKPPTPVIRIFDVGKAKDFYLDHLGFHLDWEHRFGDDFPLYAQISRANAVLHLSEHHGDGSPGAVTFMPMEGLDAYHTELQRRGQRAVIEEGPNNLRTLQIWDPFGNRLRFSERQRSIAPTAAPNAK